MNKPEQMAERNRAILAMPNIRVFYTKTGRAKYISHLDTTRCMQRALKRAGIPVWYTQGFNPHMYMTFALPLALGYESLCECMDLRLEMPMPLEEVKERLNKALPSDFYVKRVGFQQHKSQEIVQAEYQITFHTRDTHVLAERFEAFCSQKEILVVKKTKKKEKTINLKPEFQICAKEAGEGFLRYTMRFTAGQKNVNPTLLTNAFFSEFESKDISLQVLRTEIFLPGQKKYE